jgi:hypothetical protein
MVCSRGKREIDSQQLGPASLSRLVVVCHLGAFFKGAEGFGVLEACFRFAGEELAPRGLGKGETGRPWPSPSPLSKLKLPQSGGKPHALQRASLYLSRISFRILPMHVGEAHVP